MSLSVSTSCVLLCAFMGSALCECMPRNYTLWIEMDGCAQCVAVNTTICSGYCYTQDTNLRGHVGRKFLIQRACVPRSLVYRTVHVPGCRQNPAGSLQYYYPEARRCRCGRCDTRTHHCVHKSRTSPDHYCSETRGRSKERRRAAGSKRKHLET